MQHGDVWRAIDVLAAESGFSTSGLARRAGLDPTTFNLSKRHMPDGRPRWPSTESVSKALEAAGADVRAFAQLVAGARVLAKSEEAPLQARSIPLIGFAQAGNDGYFDDAGYPAGAGWDEIALPYVVDPHAYALEIAGESMEPVFRDGDTVIVSPSSPVRRGDRVVVRTTAGEAMAKQLLRRSSRRIELRSFNPDFQNRSFALSEVISMHRIVWASQ